MKVVIDIPENDYKLACNYPDALIACYAHYIKAGVPLPKKHGRLIDADEVVCGLTRAMPYFIDIDVAVPDAYVEGLQRAKIEIDDATTIVEAEDSE
jgi:hypothetical protein